jgi:hypothetical protein
MRKLWLTFTAMLLCSIASFAQIIPVQPNEGNGTAGNPYKIDTPAEFMWINSDNDAHYELTKDINLGDLGEIEGSAIISSFSGTLNGNGKTITYQASFKVTGDNQNFGLFGSVAGTGRIEKLNVNADVTMSGTGSNATLGLICGFLSDNGQISHCNVSGNINSTAAAAQYGNSSTGLIIGNSEGNLMYSTASGNLVGTGFVGGLVGSMGTVLGDAINWPIDASIKGCYFTGSVTAMNSNSAEGYRSFGGGVCGYMMPNAKIELCVAEAVVVTGESAKGLTTSGWSVGGEVGSWFGYLPKVANNYCSGTINGNEIDTDAECVNSNRYITTSGNYNPGTVIENCNKTLAECIVDALNAARCPNARNCDENFYFDVINGKVVLIIGEEQEVEEIICEAPTGFTVVKNEDNTFTASWSANGEGANTSFTESTFILTVTGGNLTQTMETTIQNAFTITSEQEQELPASENPYVFTIKSQCDENVFSVPQQVAFYVDADCEANVTLSNVTTTSATITWQGNVSTVKLGDATYQINQGQGQTYTFDNLIPATTYTAEVTFNCTRHNENNEVEPYTRTLTVDFTTLGATFITKQNGNFNDPNTWLGNAAPEGDVANITINTGHEVIVNHNLVITKSYKIVENKGVLQITRNGQLINNSTTNVPGIVEIFSPQKNKEEWTFIGAPFDGYKLETILPVSGSDISVSKYEYGATPGWSDSWATINTDMEAGEGYFAWPFYNGAVIFTTYGDVCKWNAQQQRYEIVGYDFTERAKYELNNDDVIVEKNITHTTNDTETDINEEGNWMALANPYPAKLQVNAFKGANNLQGNCVYVFREGSFDMPATDILMTEGFFVNFASAGTKSVTFTKNQLSYNAGAKASANEFIKLTLINGNKKVRAYLAHNEEAEQGYDIFDANKLFAPTEIAEPYFVTDGIALMKEEFAELPYYATMNVRSFADDTVSFVVENIPEGLSVSIIDGENIIDMVEGGVYTTEILTGENADRFKVLIKKNLGIADVEELEVNITNNNRHISIETTETDLQVEVYNALGQKVLSTKDRNFTLNQVSAGAYLIKAFNNKASKTQKIVVE